MRLAARLRSALGSRVVTLAAAGDRYYRQVTGRDPVGVVWLLGHMRAGTTLLTHLLLTNERIGSVGERNQAYAGDADLDRLVAEVCLERWARPSRYRWALDQINHSRFTPDEALLDSPRLRVIFMVREPASTIASLVRLTRDFYTEWPVERAVDYYVERLDALARYGRSIGDRTRFYGVTYSRLLDSPADVLSELQDFLGLDSGFAETYGLHPFSGRRGDPSDVLQAGRIVRGRRPVPVTIDEPLLEKARARFEACVRVLTNTGG